jgi:DNA polymerase-3 subunit delta
MPELNPDQLLERLARGKIVPAILLYGGDVYLRDMCRKQIIHAFVPEVARDWAITRLSAKDDDWDAVFERAQTLPMLAPQQVVFVENVEALERLGDERREAAVEALERYLADPAPFSVIVFEASKLDGRQKLAKVLKDKSVVVALELDVEQAPAFVAAMAKELGVEIDREAAQLISDSVNAEPGRIRMEVEKLALYVQGRAKITVEDVETLVVSARKFTVWQFSEFIASSQRGAALEFVDGLLRSGDEPLQIVGAFAWMYRNLLESGGVPRPANPYGAGRPGNRGYGPTPYASGPPRRIPKKLLLSGISALADADSQLKSGVADPRAVMEFLVARLVSAPAGT